MSDRANRSCCNFCCTFIFTSGLTALFLWLSLRPSNPTCSIQHFDVPALNKTVRFKIMGFKTKRHRIMVWAQVDVNESGQKAKKKGIKFKSGAPEFQRCGERVLLFLLVFSSTLVLLSIL
ncbi:hypothetical protein POM88_045242 [Heracleum sosnowskyi]|uniref:Uncharacterized protein n=1 Tax=Heracleum sosnowskyi TaxID=360622 RepID=A0AAD8M680_9APIA|nr:hypothetical protein POM88_045242 [Heracleum sosnowskyi]